MSDLIRTFLTSLGDLYNAKKLVTPDVRFIAVIEQAYAPLPLYGTFEGRDGIVDFISGLHTYFETQQFHIDAVLMREN